MHESIMVERNHEGDDEDYLFKHKHYKIQQIPSHTSKVMATNNFKTLNGLVQSKMAYCKNILPSLKKLKLCMAINNV